MAENKNVVLIMGKPNVGKSHSLMNLEDPDKVAYLNCDLKELPFPSKFKINIEVKEPMKIFGYIDQIEAKDDGPDTVIIDTLTFLMDMYETIHVVGAANGQQAWGEYGQFYKKLIHKIKAGTKNYIVFAHEVDITDEATFTKLTSVPIKGAVGKKGIEADFSNILQATSMATESLVGHENQHLNITEEEKEDGLKRVFVTRITKDTLGHKMRSSWKLWQRDELYIDNDINAVINQLKNYYK